MGRKNTKEKIEYIFDHAFWVPISMIWYKATLFKCIPNCTLRISEIILWSLVILFAAFGIVLSFAKSRNDFSVLVNILLPYEVYTAVVFWQDRKVLTCISLGISLLIICCYLVLIFSPKIQNRAKRKKIILRRAKQGFLGSRNIIAICMMIFFVPMGINAVFGGTLAFKNTEAETPASTRECTIANNIDIVSNLCQEKWSTLSLNERANTLQTVANIEASYLGLPHELNIKVKEVGESTLAQYDDRTHTITLSNYFLESLDASEALDSVCHEAYHAYQHRLCDAYDSMDAKYRSLIAFNDVQSYQEEFQNYTSGTSGEDDALDYYFQLCEIRAREYAEDGVDEYYYKIDLYSRESAS